MIKRAGAALNIISKFVMTTAVIMLTILALQISVNAAADFTVQTHDQNPDTWVKLEWPSVPGAQCYKIYRNDGIENIQVTVINVNESPDYTSYTDKGPSNLGLIPETSYTYTIFAYSDLEMQNELYNDSAAVRTSKMPKPTNVSAVFDIASRQIALTWTNNSLAAAESVIKKVYSDGERVDICTINGIGTVCTFADQDIENNITARYVIMSKDGKDHSSDDSEPVEVLPIAAPTLTATMTNGNATVSWGEYDYISNFILERSKYTGSSWGTWTTVISGIDAGTQQIWNTPPSGGRYRYRLIAKSSSGYSGSVVSQPVVKPAAPSEVYCTISSSNLIEVSWINNPDNISDLKIQRRSAGETEYTTIATVSASDETYSDIFSLIQGTTYYYRIMAYGSDNNVSYSPVYSISTVSPPAPTGLKLTVVSSTQIRLDWTNNASSDESFTFVLERKTDSGSFTVLDTGDPITSDITTYLDTGLQSGHTYTYRVRAYNPMGYSAYTNEVSTSTTAITAPNSLVVTPVSSSQIDLTWTYPGSGSYRTVIERKVGVSGSWHTLTTTPLAAGVKKYSDTGLSANTQYFYRIKAVSSSNSNVYSNPYPNNDGGIGALTYLGSLTLYAGASYSNRIYLAWTGSSGGTEYVIERRVPFGSFITVATLSSGKTYWYDESVIPNVQYIYRVKARTSENESVYSNEAAVVNTYLEAPTVLEASASGDSAVKLTWTDNSIDETAFEIWKRMQDSGSYDLYATIGKNSTSFTDKNLYEGIQYYYKVRAISDKTGAYSDYSNSVSIGIGIVNPPSDLKYSAASDTQVTLTWKDNSDNESSFKVERKIGEDGMWNEIASLSMGTTSYTSSGIIPYTRYFYRVKACSYSYNSESYSEEIEVSTGIPKAPSDVVLKVLSSSEIKISWTDNSENEQGFRVKRKKSAETTYKVVARIGANVTSFIDSGLKQNTKCSYKVEAYNQSGSAESSVESAATKERMTFSDLGGVSWAQDAVEVLASRGIIKGESGDLFRPNDAITRAEFVSLVIRAFNLNMTPVGSFGDVKPGKWFYNDIMTARALGIVSGDEESMFYPDKPITREDMAIIIVKTLNAVEKPLEGHSNSELEKFWDKNLISPYALASVASLYGEGIMNGKDGNAIAPKDYATRAEAAVLIYKVIDR